MKRHLLTVGTLVSLALLPGCAVLDMFKSSPVEEKAASATVTEQTESVESKMLTGEIVATLDGTPIVTSDSLEAEKDNLIKSKPELKAMLSFMDPNMLNKNLTEGLVSQEVVNKYVVDKGIDKSADYQKELADLVKNMRKILNVKFFSQQFDVSVSEKEARQFYDENKNSIPDLMLSQGGVTAKGIEFASKEDGQEFMNLVKAAGNDLAGVAQQQGVASSVKDFNGITAQSMGIDKQLKDKILATKTVPSVELVTSSTGAAWVIQIMSKNEPQYVPFEQVSQNIKQLLENNKRNEKIESEIATLRQKYNIVINEDFFKSSAGAEVAPEMSDYEQDQQVAQAENVSARRVA